MMHLALATCGMNSGHCWLLLNGFLVFKNGFNLPRSINVYRIAITVRIVKCGSDCLTLLLLHMALLLLLTDGLSSGKQ